MGKSKEGLFTEDQIRMARWAKALGHPARIAILQTLIARGPCICGDIVDELPLSQSTISQHLKAMKEAGILRGDDQGRTVCYCPDGATCGEAMRSIGALLGCC